MWFLARFICYTTCFNKSGTALIHCRTQFIHYDNTLTVRKKYEEYAKKVCDLLNNSDIRASVDDRNETIGKRIRESELRKTPFLVIVGEKEMQENAVSVRRQGGIDEGSMPVEDFIELVKKEVADQLS